MANDLPRIYDARDTSISIDNRVVTGFQDNDMFTFTAKEERITTQTDAQGFSSMGINNGRLATITLNLVATSPDYKWCMDLANTTSSFPVVIKSAYEKITVNVAFFTKPADIALGKAAGARTFTIECLDSQVEVLQ